MRPAPAWGYRGPRSFALPEFDPFWKRMEETGTIVGVPRLRLRLRPLLQRVAWRAARDGPLRTRRTVQADRAVQPPPHRGHRLVADLPRCTVAIPRPTNPARRERRVVGAVLPRPHGSRVLAVAAGVRDEAVRHLQPQHLGAGQPRGGSARADRQDRRRPGALRVGLSRTSRGLQTRSRISRTSPSSRTTRTSARSWVAT